MRRRSYLQIRVLPGKTEAKKTASMFMDTYAHPPEKQQKIPVQPSIVMKYPAENLTNTHACSYSFLSPLDKSATPFP